MSTLGTVVLDQTPDDPAAPVVATVELVDAETAARQAAVTAEASARATAVTAEATARATADSTHAALTANVHGTGTVVTSANISSYAPAPDLSGYATTTALATETTARSSGDTTNAAAAAAAQSTANAALPKAGGTMTGAIVLAADGAANLQPVTLQQLNAAIAALINSAPGALDTLKEIADQLALDESAVTALTGTVAGKLAAASNLSDLANAVTARSNLGLGTAATHANGDYEVAGAAATAQAAAIAASQPLDSDLTAIAALTTTTYGRAFLALADAAAGRTALGLGTVATHAHTEYDASGAAAAAQAASQPLDSDLTAIAALTTTSFGRGLLAVADAAAGRTALGVGGPAITAGGNLGTTSTFAMDASSEKWLTGTLDNNVVITVTPATGGRVRLFLTQDATGNRTVTVSDGTNTLAVTVQPVAAAVTVVNVSSPDGTALYVEVQK